MSGILANRIRARVADNYCKLASASTPKPRVLYCKRNKASKRELAHCEATGFHPPELIKNRVYHWTDGEAVLTCSLPRPVKLQWMWIDLATGPHPNVVKVIFNDVTLLSRHFKGRLKLRLRLPRLPISNRFKIQIVSDTFVPAETLSTHGDERTLGILVGEIRVAKYWWRNIGLPWPFRS